MNEKKIMNVASVPTDALTTLKINGGFYQRLNKLLLDHVDNVDEDLLLGALLKIKKNLTKKDTFAYNLETLMMLLKGIEEAYQNEGLLVDNEIEIEIPEGLAHIKTGLEKTDEDEGVTPQP